MPSKKKKMQLPLSKCNIFFLCLGTTLVILGATSLACFSRLHNHILSGALEFGPDTEAYKAWQKPKTPITMDIYFFNWTNPEEIYNPLSKPHFVEMGPYRYIQIKEKTNLTWHNENQTISYQYLKHFYFDEENSPNHHSDVVTTINMVALTAAKMADDWNFFFREGVKLSLSSANISIQKNVSELLFDGYQDPVLVAANSIPFISDGKGDRFGWFHGRNGSIGLDGVYNMKFTPDIDFGTLKNWNYDDRTIYFEGHCADIKGSAGEMFPRNVKPTRIRLFSPEMCRSVQFNFEKNVSVKGIPAYKYSPGAEVFDNGTEIESNTCFCNGRCLPSGVLNVSACREDAPVFLSLPHFYKADSSYVKAVGGLRPEQDKHELYITLEPNTGIIADISARMQVNVLLQRISGFKLFDKVRDVMFPVLWFDQKVVMSDELVSGLSLLFSLPKINKIISLLVVIVGLVCIVSVILFVTCYKQKKMTHEHKITREEIPLNSKS